MSSPEVTKLVSDHDNESVEATTFKDQTWDIDINVSKCFQFSMGMGVGDKVSLSLDTKQ